MSDVLKGKLKTWSLNTDDRNKGEKYFITEINYGLLRKYAHTEVYNPETNEGEQRNSKSRHINRLKNEIINENYTPQCFNLSITDLSIANIDDKGNVTIPLYEDNKLVILDGGSRFQALSNIRSENPDISKTIDMLPVPVIVYLEPNKRKQNFLNLNNGTKVNKSHLQSMQIATGRMSQNKLPIFERAKSLSILLNNNEFSPLNNMISYGNTDETGKISLSQIITDHKGSLIASLFGSSKILNAIEKSDEWFVDQFSNLYDLIKERTDYLDKGKLLVLPSDGPKGNVANWLSLLNTTLYYLYLKEQIDQSGELEDNISHIIDCAKIYNNLVDGDVSRSRRQLLSQAYAQRLFHTLESVDELPTGMHHGIPISLLILTSESGFRIELMSKPK